MNRNEERLQKLWDNIETIICDIGGQEGLENAKGGESLFEEIITENFPVLERDTNIQVWLDLTQ
jgi:hypothetical protein